MPSIIESSRLATPLSMSQPGLLVIVSPERVKLACIARGWSLTELAVRARISRPTLRSALRGQPVRPRTAWKLARALRQEDPAQAELAGLLETA